MKRLLMIPACVLACLFVLAGSAAAEWSETPPDAVYVTKTQYRSRAMETMASEVPEAEGWTLLEEVPGPWGDWISTGTEPVEEALDREVKTVPHAAVTEVTGYSYKRYRYYNSSDGSYYLTYGSSWATSHGYSGAWQYKTTASRLAKYKVYDSNQSYGAAGDFWFFETVNTREVTPAWTEYQYRTRSRSYVLMRWLGWSAWQDEPIAAADGLEVETRTLYAADERFLPSTIVAGRVPAVTLVTGTGCQLRYANNGADLQWQSSDPNVAAVDGQGYLSAHRAGSAAVSVGGETIAVTVLDAPEGLLLPAGTGRVEASAFEGGTFAYADLGSAAEVGAGAFGNNPALRLVVLDGPAEIDADAFLGSPNAVAAVRTTPGAVGVPYYVIGEARAFIPVTKITLSAASLSVVKGKTASLTASLTPADATNPGVTWVSDDPSVAMVSADGKVTGVREGSCVITAMAADGRGAGAMCVVTVKPASVTGDAAFTSVAAESVTAVAATVRFKFNASPNATEGGFYLGTSSGNLRLVKSESYTGAVKEVYFSTAKYYGALTPDTTYYYQVYYVSDGVKYLSAVHSFKTLAAVTISPVSGSRTVGEGDTLTLRVTTSPADADVTWTSSSTAVATVSSAGVVTGVKGGTVTITATASANGTTATAVFEMSVNPVIYRVLLDVNYAYTREQVMEWWKVPLDYFNEFLSHFSFLGKMEGSAFRRSDAKVNDGEVLARAYRTLAHRQGLTPKVSLITDVTKATLYSSIRSWFADADWNDVNVLYIGAHGNEKKGICLQTSEYILPADLAAVFNGINGRNVILLSTCYSGMFKNMSSGTSANISVICSSSATQETWSNKFESYEFSLDIYHFLRGIGYSPENMTYDGDLKADTDHDDKVTLREIVSYMKPGVQADAARLDEVQDVQESLSSGSIVIYRK